MPGLNGPGLVPAKKVPRQAKPEFETIRDNGSINHFWNGKGIMNSVPKMKVRCRAHELVRSDVLTRRRRAVPVAGHHHAQVDVRWQLRQV